MSRPPESSPARREDGVLWRPSAVLAVTERRDIRANQSEVATTSRSAKPVLLIGRVRPSWSLISGYFGPIGSRQLGDLDCVIKYCGAQEKQDEPCCRSG